MRIAVVSDVHANLPALDAVIEAVDAVDAWWHCGDVVDYGPHPDEVVARLRDLGARGVLGNHDAAALGSSVIEWFNPYAHAACLWTRERMAPDTRAWLEALPESAEIGGWALVHGSFRKPLEEYVEYPDEAAASMAISGARLALHGHTHVPRAWRKVGRGAADDRFSVGVPLALGGDTWFLNPGSVGQPRDHDPRAAALVLDTDAGTATLLRVTYDVARTQADIRRAGLPSVLADRLGVGR